MSIQELPVELIKLPKLDNLYNIWNHLKGTVLDKSEAEQFIKDCFDDYGVFVLFKEHPKDNTKYVVASVSDLDEEYFYKPKDELLTADGKSYCEEIPVLKTIKRETRNSMNEKEYNNILAKHLENKGWNVETPFTLPYGQIDVFASNGKEALIYEVKTDSKFHTIINALGQVLAYREQIRDLNLRCYIAVPEDPDSFFIQNLLTKFGVKLVIFGGTEDV
jgi:Holliday junction resolvase-like predicted endonuclease